MSIRYVYSFNEGSKEMKSLLGGKGANLAEMTKIGLPVPPGFTITTEACNDYYQNDKTIKQNIIDEIEEKLSVLEKDLDKKLGFEVRFRPAYFPYTYLSVESEIYLEEKESWIELGGSGMFRPEVLKPLGINQPALAFGLGIERLAMIRYDVEDIRMLYKSDLKWLRELPLDKGVEL